MIKWATENSDCFFDKKKKNTITKNTIKTIASIITIVKQGKCTF